MRKVFYSFTAIILLGITVSYGVDQNPISAGNTQTRNALGRTYEASLQNPALLGVERAPKGGITFPLSNMGVGAWSDKLAILPLLGGYIDEPSLITSEIFRRSFNLDGLDPDEVSDKLTKEFKGGVRVYSGFRNSLLSAAWNRFSFDITTHFDEEVHIPEGPLYMLFSKDKGLLRGKHT